MTSDMRWAQDLGNAFLAQQQDVMDAVQRMRQQAQRYGYLGSNGQVVVTGGPYISIVPVNPRNYIRALLRSRLLSSSLRGPDSWFAVAAIRFNYGITASGSPSGFVGLGL